MARAEENQNLLHGPHPFLKDNELSVHVLIGEGQGDALSGAKLELGYGYKLTGGAAALLAQPAAQLRAQRLQSCDRRHRDCAGVTGDIVETMAGVKWKFATPIPLVPYLQGNAGLVFAFPNGATDAMGVAIRAAGGANYFFFDWLGLGDPGGLLRSAGSTTTRPSTAATPTPSSTSAAASSFSFSEPSSAASISATVFGVAMVRFS